MEKDCFEISQAVRILEALEARELRNMILSSSYPEMKKDSRAKIDRDINRISNLSFEEKKRISNAELAKLLGAKNGIR